MIFFVAGEPRAVQLAVVAVAAAPAAVAPRVFSAAVVSRAAQFAVVPAVARPVAFVVDILEVVLQVSAREAVAPAAVPVAAETEAASDDIAAVAVFLILLSVVADGVDSPAHSTFSDVPNAGHSASASSSGEACREESFHSPIDARASDGLCNSPSIPGRRQNRIPERRCNNSSRDYNTVTDTSGHPRGATTSRSRKTSLFLCRARHRHRLCPASRLHREEPEMQPAAVHSSRRPVRDYRMSGLRPHNSPGAPGTA